MSTDRSIFFRGNRRRPDYRRHYAQLPRCLSFAAHIMQQRRAAHSAMLQRVLQDADRALPILGPLYQRMGVAEPQIRQLCYIFAVDELKKPSGGIEQRATSFVRGMIARAIIRQALRGIKADRARCA